MNTYEALDCATLLSNMMRTGILVTRKDPSDTRCIYVYRDESPDVINDEDGNARLDMNEEGWTIADPDLKRLQVRAEVALSEIKKIEKKLKKEEKSENN